MIKIRSLTALRYGAMAAVGAFTAVGAANAQSVDANLDGYSAGVLEPSAVSRLDYGGGYKMGSLLAKIDPRFAGSRYDGLFTGRHAPIRFGGGRGEFGVYGQLNDGWLNVDNGNPGRDNDYFSTNGASLNELGARIKYDLNQDLTIGARLSAVAAFNRSDILNDYYDDPGCDERDLDNNFCLYSASLYLKSRTLGKITLGLGETASTGIGAITLGGTAFVTNNDPTIKGGWNEVYGTGRTLNDIAPDVTGVTRANLIRYDTPTLAGFSMSASWGEANHVGAAPDAQDYWDVALRYAGEFGAIRVAAGVGYQDYDREGKNLSQSNVTFGGSLMHVPTGLYVAGSVNGISRDADFKPGAGETDSASAYYLQGGISQTWFDIGKTTFYGETGKTESGANAGAYFVDNSKTTNWGLGVVQNFDAAATSLYLTYNVISADVSGLKGDDIKVIYAGARIKF